MYYRIINHLTCYGSLKFSNFTCIGSDDIKFGLEKLSVEYFQPNETKTMVGTTSLFTQELDDDGDDDYNFKIEYVYFISKRP